MVELRLRTLGYVGVGAAGLALIAFALWPAPIPVETGSVVIGPMQVTTDDQGETRSHDRFVIAAPVTGRLLRVLLHDGDAVAENEVVATIAPVPLSTREHDEQTARVAAAEANRLSAEAQLSHVLEDLAQAQRERDRVEQLLARALVPRQQVEQAQNSAITLQKEVDAARFRAKQADAELRGAKAALTALGDNTHGEKAVITLRAPAAGRVLRISQASERVVTAGTPILVIGDLGHLEVVIEMLSSEAVKVAPGMPALLEGWGGEAALRAIVRRVEPYAFTKISALGVEEKRTNVILDFVDPPGALGDGFRVTGRIIVWSDPRVVEAPLSALFRCGSNWCVFVVDGKHARRREVRIGHYNSVAAEILSGLRANEQVVRHPPNELADGSRISPRDRGP